MEFKIDFEPNHGKQVQISEGVVRVTAPNSGPFTFHGTNSYIVGRSDLMVIDPGPIDDSHFKALIHAIGGRSVSHILVTHTHADHSPLAERLKQETGATTAGFGRHVSARALRSNKVNVLDASADRFFLPDLMLGDCDTISNTEVSMKAIHTPGHAANHLCFALKNSDYLFSGDHIMAWATTIIAPPDGSMNDYFDSIDKLQKRKEKTYLPGHGGPVTRPQSFLRALKSHRLMREASILDMLTSGPLSIPDIVQILYRDTDRRLHGAAALTVFAHLERLVALGSVRTDDLATLGATYYRT